MTLDALREANAPLCSRTITDVLIQRKGIEHSDILIARIQKNIIAILHRLESGGLVTSAKTKGERGVMQWQLV